MPRQLRSSLALVVLTLWAVACFASAYDAKPKLVVIVVVDQLRGDLLERYHDDFGEGGFRLLMDHGAWFTSCYYNYAATKTAPGHATLGTGTYALGHGIFANEWWDPKLRHLVSSVEDENTKPIGLPPGVTGEKWSASPNNLQTDTIGDELKLATSGRAKVYGIALKDRAAILPVGFSADGAFFIDPQSGAFVTSSYYMQQAPAWLVKFNASATRQSYLNREVKDAAGNVLRSTAPVRNDKGQDASFYDLVGATPWGNDYTVEIAKQIIENEKLGTGAVTDLISVSFSSPDILGHKVGPDSPEHKAMLIALDRTVADFFQYLDAKVGKGNWAVALSADHGIAPMTDFATKLRIPAFNFSPTDLQTQLNYMLGLQYGKDNKYVVYIDYPTVHLDSEAFDAVSVQEADAEKTVGELMLKLGFRSYSTKVQMAAGNVNNTVFRQQTLNAYSPLAGWYVTGLYPPFQIGYASGTGHALPYSYDAHVPLAFYGAAFRPGVYRENVEPVDLAVTLSSLLRINKPASAVGRALHEAFADNPGVAAAKGSK
ncbi:MAG TPA: alkaline phosphatase family protein [Candidatus Saccharimonadales bacterium]|nr:alkaline phosphatase family protein [Candidatus Saccharimonadales bacterium]